MPTDPPSYRLTDHDASFLYQESAVSQMHGGMIFFLKGELPFDKLFHHIRSRLHVTPRFRQRLVFPPFNLAHPTLEDDPAFKLENHVQRRTLAAHLDEAGAVQEILRYNNSRLLDRARPLWCVTLFAGLPGHSLVLWEMHHAIMDGVSGFDLLTKTLDFTPHPAFIEPAQPWTPAKLPTPTESYLRALRDTVVKQVDTATQNMQEFMRDPLAAVRRAQAAQADSARVLGETAQANAIATPWNAGVVTEERKAAWLNLPFGEFRAIRAAFGGTINDVVLTVLGEGAARYLKDHGWPTEGRFRIGCPVNVRRPGEEITLENRVSIMMPMTSAEPMDVVERLRAMVVETKQIKDSGAPYVLERMMTASSAPPAMLAALGQAGARQMEALAQYLRATNWKPSPAGPNAPVTGINFMATNIPGPQTTWYLAGSEVSGFVAAVSLTG
ncbi:MAG: wax ester/triacylglycerol synthase domain-containing protein, partial [Candidatus Binataceae bacterium]